MHKQIGLPLRGRLILLSLVWLQTELDCTQSYTIITLLVHKSIIAKIPSPKSPSSFLAFLVPVPDFIALSKNANNKKNSKTKKNM